MPFPDALKRLRQRAGLSQEQVAHAFGRAGQSTIANYEKGIREPKASEIPDLARALQATVAELFDEPAGPSQLARLDAGKLADLIETVEAAEIQANRQIPPAKKARLVASLYASGASGDAVKATLASILATLED